MEKSCHFILFKLIIHNFKFLTKSGDEIFMLNNAENEIRCGKHFHINRFENMKMQLRLAKMKEKEREYSWWIDLFSCMYEYNHKHEIRLSISLWADYYFMRAIFFFSPSFLFFHSFAARLHVSILACIKIWDSSLSWKYEKCRK